MSINLKDLLRTTLTDVEKSAESRSDDRALSELKHSLVRSVAELDVKREEQPQPQTETDQAALDNRAEQLTIISLIGSHSRR